MSKRDWKLLLEDILDSIKKIEEFTNGLSYGDFEKNSLVTDAVVRNIEIIGEASKNIPTEIQQLFSDIPWQKLRGIRNRIVHDYFDVNRNIIWYIVTKELEPLKKTIINHLQNN
ncbi:MAG: DUF86 domain-containing protein [Bacteroidetes bacterium]|nr:DUF86 domain-containing protein [Bacteroidota bacterium]MBU1679130.1 DUF86 domain-containing protein [Bacteroidota bacterium]MBU2507483.1 DUF86 domain-containing protein [Bacteroidota bacterium]